MTEYVTVANRSVAAFRNVSTTFVPSVPTTPVRYVRATMASSVVSGDATILIAITLRFSPPSSKPSSFSQPVSTTATMLNAEIKYFNRFILSKF